MLTLTANNTYTGSTLVNEGTLVVRGSQPNSPAGVVKTSSAVPRLSGTGTVGFIAAAKGGMVDPGAGNTLGTLTSAGANFSDAGVLRLRIDQNTAATDFDSLFLGTGELVLGTNSPLQFDLAGLSSPRQVVGMVRYGVRLGVANVFSPVSTLNNPNNFTATPTYTATAMNVAIANPAPRAASGEGTPVGYRNGDPSVPLLATAAFSSKDFANLAGSQLLVRITSGEDATNRLLIGGPFKVDGNDVLLEGVVIGSLNESGGEGTTELRVTFNANATAAIAKSLVKSIRFRASDSSSTSDRVIEFSITD